MSTERDEIAQRELRNNVGAVLREVASGRRLRITVRGRPVAELVPIGPGRRFAQASDVAKIIEAAPLDEGFSAEVEAVLGATIEEL